MPPVLALTLALWAVGVQDRAPAASGGLAAARELYASAQYEQALDILGTVNAADDLDEADQYRALCLLALGRMREVEQVLESLIVRNPFFRMSDAVAPPRLLALFDKTRERLLPDILQSRYASARATFERGNYSEASAQFRALLTLVQTAATTHAPDMAVIADLRVLAEGFLELADAALKSAPVVNVVDMGASVTGREKAAIGDAVQQYAQAYSALDVEAVARIFPGASSGALHAAFDGLKSQAVEARDVDIVLDAGEQSATVTLTWALDAVPNVGGAIRTQMPATLRMSRSAAGQWSIVERR